MTTDILDGWTVCVWSSFFVVLSHSVLSPIHESRGDCVWLFVPELRRIFLDLCEIRNLIIGSDESLSC